MSRLLSAKEVEKLKALAQRGSLNVASSASDATLFRATTFDHEERSLPASYESFMYEQKLAALIARLSSKTGAV